MESVELIEGSRAGNRFDKLLMKLRDDLGFEHVNFGMMDPATGKAIAYSTYASQWKQHYMEMDYSRIDPSVSVVGRGIVPVDWENLKKYEGYKKVFSAAEDYGIPRQGLTIPVRGVFGEVGLVSVSAKMSRREWHSITSDRITDLQQYSAFLADHISGVISPISEHIRPNLSCFEREVLQYIGAGRDMDEIAGRLNISERLASIYLKSAQTKLRALSVPQAVGRAIQQRIISPI